MKPYTDEKITDNKWIRTFDPSITESEEYIWHIDRNNRSITVLEGDDWKFQFDNELPMNININDRFTVPKMVHHRLIPGKTKLRIEINEEL